MYARVGDIEFAPEDEAKLVTNYGDNIGITKSQKGYRGVLLLTDPATGKGISISLWNSKADCLATEAKGGSLDRAIKASAGEFKKAPKYRYFDVRFIDRQE